MAIAFRDAGGGAGHHGQFARLGVAGQLRAVEQPLPDVAARRFFAQHHHGFWQAPGFGQPQVQGCDGQIGERFQCIQQARGAGLPQGRIQQAGREGGRHRQHGGVKPFLIDDDAVVRRLQLAHGAAVAHRDLARCGVRPQGGEVRAGQQQVAVCARAGQAVAQHARKQRRAGRGGRRVQRGQAKGFPDLADQRVGLRVVMQQLLHRPVARRHPRHGLQAAHQAQGGKAVGPRQAACAQDGNRHVQRGGQARGGQMKAAIQGSQAQGPAHQQGIGIAAHAAHQRQRVLVGARQQMLAIVQRGVEIAMEHAAGAPARRVAGFEDGDLGAGFAQGDACRQPRPACADNRRLHRANRRTSPRPPPTQHLPVVAFDLVKQRVIDGGHHQPRPLRPAVGFGQVAHRFAVKLAGTVGLELHQGVEAVRILAIQDVRGLDLELLHVIDGDVDAAAAGVVADVPDDVGHLERQAQLFGVDQRLGIAVAEDAGGQLAHDAGGLPAVIAHARPIQVAGLVQVHLHAIDHGQQALAGDRTALQLRLQRPGHRVVRLAVEHLVDLRAPPGQLDAGQRRIGAFVDHVVHFAAIRVQRGDRAAAFRRQEQERVVEAGTALGGFLLAVFVRGHRLGRACYLIERHSMMAQSLAPNSGRFMNTS
ncbi:hypothetical protein G6F22_011289 [Rhizopus arrhizus]|nr:hypothetical protein G6F22_011289 [Rhizopus arrhizus]